MRSKRTEFCSEEFLNRIRQADRGAFTELVQAYTDQLYRAALGLGFDSRTAQDVTQNAWLTFFDVAPKFKGASHIRTFIFGIFYNKASEFRKVETRFETSDPIEDLLEHKFDSTGHWLKPPIDPEHFVAATQIKEILNGCIETLPLSQRMAFTLREIEEEETSDICKVLEVSATYLGVLLYRARNRLRECVERKSHK